MEDSFRSRVRAGDADAFVALFDGHARDIYRYACRVSGDSAMAEDVVSQTFLEAWRLRRRVRPEGGDLGPWLYGIATNLLRNSRRSARRRGDATARLPRPEPAPDHADELARLAQEREERQAARAALQALRPADREVVTLCVWSGLTYAQAAEALAVPVGTIRSRLSRAKCRLQELGRIHLEAMDAGSMELQEASGQGKGVSTPTARPAEEIE